MEVLELKHGLGVRLVIFGLTSSDTKTSLPPPSNLKPVAGLAPPVLPCSSLSLSAGFDSLHG